METDPKQAALNQAESIVSNKRFAACPASLFATEYE
jgi:hypothetical protein